MKYLYLQSALHNSGALERQSESLFNELGNLLDVKFEKGNAAQLREEDLSLVFVASGGTAGLFRKALDELPDPVVLITSGTDNSLSAAMEMNTYLTMAGRSGHLLHGSAPEIADELKVLHAAGRARKALFGMKFGMVGQPSDWLISTAVDYSVLTDQLGIEIVDIEMEELLREIALQSYPEDEDTKELLKKQFDPEQIQQALYIYGAFHRLAEKYQLQGMSVRCFDLLTAVKNTGCLGLALLNAKGIYGGCEGDLPSLVSMAILGEISGRPVFQSNPSRIHKAANEVVFAHCTLPLHMTADYTLKTHFESGIGVAIAGKFPKERVTIFKASADLSRYFNSGGAITKSLNESNLCRSQMQVSFDKPVSEFLSTPVGNHYLITYGDYSREIDEFFSMMPRN